MTKTHLTVSQLFERLEDIHQSGYTMSHSIETFKKENEYPFIPVEFKPRLGKEHTVEEAEEYAKNLKAFLKDEADRKEQRKIASEYNGLITQAIEMFIKNESGLNRIPEQYRDKVYSKAYSDGHSGGFMEVYNHLIELVGIFE